MFSTNAAVNTTDKSNFLRAEAELVLDEVCFALTRHIHVQAILTDSDIGQESESGASQPFRRANTTDWCRT